MQERKFRMDSVQGHFSKPVFETRNPGNISFCFQRVSPAPEVCGMESESMKQSYRCPVSSMDSRKLLRFSYILLHPPGVKQNTKRSYTYSDFDNTILANSAMVSQSFEHTGSITTAHKIAPRLLVDSSGRRLRLLLKDTFTLVAWKVSGKNCLTEEFLNKQPDLPPSQEEQVLWEIKNQPGRSGLAGVIGRKLIRFGALETMF